MALSKIKLAPGIVSDTTNYSNSGGWFDCNLVRFRGGLPEKMGGWTRAYTSQTPLTGICRKMVSWSDTDSNRYTALPTDKKFYIDDSATITDISAARRSLTIGTDPITTTNLSSTIQITDINHGATLGDYVVVSGCATVGGVTSTSINTTHIITEVIDQDNFTIDTGDAASSSTTGGGSGVVVDYLFYSSGGSTTSVSGWGAGGWGGADSPTISLVITSGITTDTATNTTVDGLAKSTVTITTPTAHGAAINDWMIMSGVSAVGGMTVANLQKANKILSVPSGTTFTIQVEGTATSSVTGGGAAVTLRIYSASTAYGWSDSPSSTTTTAFSGMWSVDSYGEDMVACPRNMVIPFALGTNPVATTNASTTVTITQTNHGYATGDAPVLAGLTTTEGIGAIYLNGSHIITVTGDDTYTFVADVAATGTGTGGGALAYAYLSPLIYWDVSAGGRAVSFSKMGSAYTKKYMPYSATEVLTSDINRHVIALGTNPFDTTKSIDRMLIRFSDSNDPTNWDASDTTKTSGELRCSAGSYIVTGIQNREEIIVWTDTSLYTMNYVGAPYTYGLQLVGSGFDIIGPNSKAVAGSTAYWMGYNNFYSYNGRIEPMPCPVRDYVFLDINRSVGSRVYCSTDSGNNEIIWFYPSAASEENDRYVIYNYAEQVWYYGALCRSAWMDRGTYENPRAICTSGYLFVHESGTDDGSTTPATAINAYVESSPIEIEQGDHYGFVSRIIPDLSFRDTDLSIMPEPVVKFIVKPQNFPGGQTYSGNTREAERSSAATLHVNRFTEQLFTRIRGRSIVLRVESDELGVSWRMGAPRLDIKADGRK